MASVKDMGVVCVAMLVRLRLRLRLRNSHEWKEKV